MTRGGGLTFSPNFSSLPLTVWVGKWFEDLEEKDDLINERQRVCRTAPATPGPFDGIWHIYSNRSVIYSGSNLKMRSTKIKRVTNFTWSAFHNNDNIDAINSNFKHAKMSS